MQINIYYGGRSIVDDPTLFVLDKFEKVLRELNVNVIRYNLAEYRSGISALPNTLKDADGIILASTLEWYGIGGDMQLFLDACWMYGDKAHINKIYMYPLVMAKTYGEREAKDMLMNAWELLGGKPLEGICAYVDDTIEFEMNKDYLEIIENSAENLYRGVSKKYVQLPTSSGVIKQNVMKEVISLTPKETEQLSKYVANEEYVQTQRKDIEELSGLFKDMLKEQDNGGDEYYLKPFEKAYRDFDSVGMCIQLTIVDKNKNILINVGPLGATASINTSDVADLSIRMSGDIFDDIINGRKTFQRAFMSGEITSKGDFVKLRKLDSMFNF